MSQPLGTWSTWNERQLHSQSIHVFCIESAWSRGGDCSLSILRWTVLVRRASSRESTTDVQALQYLTRVLDQSVDRLLYSFVSSVARSNRRFKRKRHSNIIMTAAHMILPQKPIASKDVATFVEQPVQVFTSHLAPWKKSETSRRQFLVVMVSRAAIRGLGKSEKGQGRNSHTYIEPTVCHMWKL